ncbi:hypothetical protein KJ682_03430 [bacterium]|nr:hypothetical protein [bacterium]
MVESEGSFWIPNPLEIADLAVTASAPWKDSILMAGPTGLYLLDCRETLKPRIHSQALGSYTDLAVGGDLVAAVESSHVDIFRLPALDPLARITFSAGDLVVAIQDSLLGVADPRNLFLYALSDPGNPHALGSVNLGLGTRTSQLGHHLCLGYPFAIATEFGGGNNVLGWYGKMSVVDITDPSQPVVSDFHDHFPEALPWDTFYFIMTVPYPPGFLLYSVVMDFSNPYPYDGYHFVTRFTVGPEGKVEWDHTSSAFHGTRKTGTVFTEGSKVFFKSNDSPFEVADAGWDHPNFLFSPAGPDIGPLPLSWIPEQDLVACGSSLFRMADLGHTPVQIFNGGSSALAKLDERTAVKLRWWSVVDFGYTEWSLESIDLSLRPPEMISNIMEGYDYARELALVGRRAYLSDPRLQADIAADGTIAPAEATTFPPITAVLAWDQYQVVSHDDNFLGIYTLDQNNDPCLVASLPNLPAGQLLRIGDYLYLGGSGQVSVIDLGDPLAPDLMGMGPLAGRFGSISGNRLFTFDDSFLYLHDIGNPLAPVTKGSQDIGSTIHDVLALGNRVYLALGSKGVAVMQFVPGFGVKAIGGDVFTQATRLILTDSGILTDTRNRDEVLHILPLSRFDLSPVSGTAMIPSPGYRPRQAPGGTLASPALTLSSEPDAGAGLSAHPNPANPLTLIRYFVPQEGLAKLAVFSLDGRRVATIVDGYQPAGPGSAQWDGTDHGGRPVPSGVYLLRLETEKAVSNGRVTLIR